MSNQKIKKILIVVVHPVGGIRNHISYTYRHIPTDCYKFTVIAPTTTESAAFQSQLDELNIDTIFVDGNLKNFFKAVGKLITSRSFDIVHAHGFTSLLVSLPSALIMRTPSLLTVHDVFTSRQFGGIKGKLKQYLLATALLLTTAIVFVSTDCKNNVLSFMPILKLRKKAMHVIENGIRIHPDGALVKRDFRQELKLSEECVLIGFFGRFMSQKGFRHIINFAATARQEGLARDFRVLTFGDDGFFREEKARIAQLGLSDRFCHLPLVTDAASSVMGVDMVVMPSLWEASGLLAMEALCLGTPLIASSCVGLREVAAGSPARLVPPGDDRHLYDAIISEMQAPGKEQASAYKAAAIARFDVKTAANRFTAVYDQLLS